MAQTTKDGARETLSADIAELRDDLNALREDIAAIARNATSDARDAAGEQINAATDAARDAADQVCRQADQAHVRLSETLRDKPLTSIAVAAAAGAVLARILGNHR